MGGLTNVRPPFLNLIAFRIKFLYYGAMVNLKKEQIATALYLAVGILVALIAGFGRSTHSYADISVNSLRYIFLILTLLLGVLAMLYAYKNPPPRAWTYATTIFVAFIFLFFPPLVSGDALTSLLRVKIFALTKTNPYIIAPSQFPGDPWISGTSWRHIPMPYGPLWTLFSMIFFPFIKGSLASALFVYKLVISAAAVACGRILFKISERLETNGRKTELLFLWNPLLLLTVFSDSHNDILMMLLLLLGLFFLLKDKYQFALLALTGSILIKYATILVLPFFLLAIYRKLGNIKAILKTTLPALIMSLGFFYIFWQGSYTFRGVLLASGIVSPNSLIAHTANLFGLGIGFFVKAKEWILGSAAVTVVIIFLWSARARGRIIKGMTFSLMALLFFVTDLFNWYLLWPLALLPLWEKDKPPLLLIVLTTFGVLHIYQPFWNTAILTAVIAPFIIFVDIYGYKVGQLCWRRVFGRV